MPIASGIAQSVARTSSSQSSRVIWLAVEAVTARPRPATGDTASAKRPCIAA